LSILPSLRFIYPELVLVGFALAAMMGATFVKRQSLIGFGALIGVVLGIFLLPVSFEAGPAILSSMLSHDSFSIFFRTVILLIAGLIVLLSIGDKEGNREDIGEYYFFLLTVTVAMMIAVSANNLMMIYIAVETISIISYIMAGFLKRNVISSEAGMKYFLFGALSTGVMLYGISLLFGLFGTLSLPGMMQATLTNSVNPAALTLSVILVIVGLGFKCSLVPFHMWTPDVYEGAPTPVSALLSVGPKAVGFALFIRIFVENIVPLNFPWVNLATVMAIVTMTVGNISALKQNNIKRLLAFSTIAQAGYIFIGLTVGTAAGTKATLFYLFVYTLMNVGAFAAVISISNSLKSEAIEHYAGLYKKEPFTAIALAISLLSLAGLPPLSGFLAKFFVLAAAVDAKLVFLAVIAVINSVIALYYYIRVVKFMFLHQPTGDFSTSRSVALTIALTVTAFGNIILGVWPHPILNWLTSLSPL